MAASQPQDPELSQWIMRLEQTVVTRWRQIVAGFQMDVDCTDRCVGPVSSPPNPPPHPTSLAVEDMLILN